MNKVTQIVTEKIIEKIEQGDKTKWSQAWKTVAPQNITGREYTGVNRLLLSLTPYKSPFWLTFKQVEERKGKIKKGAKSEVVVFYQNYKKEITAEDGGISTKNHFILRYYLVFNADCVEGIKLPEYEVMNDSKISAEQVIENWHECPIEYGGSENSYSPTYDRIRLVNRENFNSAEDFCAIAFHELIHATGHESRLKREYGRWETEPYCKEELVAELGSSFLCAQFGIEQIDNSAAYLRSWLQPLKEGTVNIISAAAQAEKAVNYIIEKTAVLAKQQLA